ncbi:FliI/YscN family ATPase [Humisphaera borealis]|uniref:FliI/YscN family ATPase n=2 Tax=Humisphaera borealis TaxID=2807512 RepID=A0A7M2X3F7_9BACT|nr:FliI/YscN family ATPase [Humisphaera borealis]
MPFAVRGRIESVSGMTLEATDLPLAVGSLCSIDTMGGRTASAEVIGFRGDRTLLMPLSSPAGIARGDGVSNLAASPRIWCSDDLLGRVINGFGEPIDGGPPIQGIESRRLDARSPHPLQRQVIRKPIATSIRSIDALHTCGLGQRMGIFSGPGVGKSTLMGSIAKYTSADISVVALIGERGREVQEFIENSLGTEGLSRCVVIVSTGDEAPLRRVRAAKAACAVAEYFRDRGKDVLLMMDSLTRLCQAQRQIGLAAGEPPATKGFPPSVFAMIPEILERAGNTPNGSITGFYTVLVEGDDFNEPIPDAVKGITDGHFWLNRKLANRGHFPALDVTQSISRVRGDVTDKDHQRQARRVLALWSIYQDIEDLVNIGAYAAGANAEYDLAVAARPKITDFLKQESSAPATFEQSRKQLAELAGWIDQMDAVIRSPKRK